MSGACVRLLSLCLVPACLTAADEPAATPSATPPPLRDRLRQPLGSPRLMGSRDPAVPMLRFEERIDVVAPPLDLARLRAEWTRHWNLSGYERAATGPPVHSEMREHWRHLAELSGVPQAQGVPITGLLAAAGQAIAKRVSRKTMPPADPRPAAREKREPLLVVVDDDDAVAGVTPTPTPTPEAKPRPVTEQPNSSPRE